LVGERSGRDVRGERVDVCLAKYLVISVGNHKGGAVIVRELKRLFLSPGYTKFAAETGPNPSDTVSSRPPSIALSVSSQPAILSSKSAEWGKAIPGLPGPGRRERAGGPRRLTSSTTPRRISFVYGLAVVKSTVFELGGSVLEREERKSTKRARCAMGLADEKENERRRKSDFFPPLAFIVIIRLWDAEDT
jgi:hypothetical protein